MATWSIHNAQDFLGKAVNAVTPKTSEGGEQTDTPVPESGLDLTICTICGTQYDSPAPRDTCPICEDPRQYVPASGLAWSTLAELRTSGKYTNDFSPLAQNPHATAISTSPRFGIGQRAILLRTAHGNVLWDCVAYLDKATIARVRELGGLAAIVVSHPHFYTTAGVWAETFNCSVYTSALDAQWLQRKTARHVLFASPSEIPLVAAGEVDVAVAGGHFPGSLVLLHQHRLYTADTIQVVPSGLNPKPPTGHGKEHDTVSFAFMWSYPNMIPLHWEAVRDIWKRIKYMEFRDVHGGFAGLDLYGEGKKRVYDSARIVIAKMGGDADALY